MRTADGRIYLDHAATTPLAAEALEAMLPWFRDQFGNSETLYSEGAKARFAVESSREVVADALQVDPSEIYFTSGGTESNNWAVKGTAQYSGSARRHILISATEHKSVLESAASLQHLGFQIEHIPVNSNGVVEPEYLRTRINRDTCLVSVHHANNETGVIQPIAEIADVCRTNGTLLHVDAVQTFLKLTECSAAALGADLITLSAHKVYGPKGVGALWIRRGVPVLPHQCGGSQERGMRGGTLNVPGIVGFAAAVNRLKDRYADLAAVMAHIRSVLEDHLTADPAITVTAAQSERVPHITHLTVENLEAEPLLLSLDMEGVSVGAGSACSSGSTEPSHVLRAMGMPLERARGALRFSLGENTTEADAVEVAQTLHRIVPELRQLGI
jgi:cysteine desulfurase